MSAEPIRIAGREGVLNKSADSWQLITHSRGVARAFGLVGAALPGVFVGTTIPFVYRNHSFYEQIELILMVGLITSIVPFYLVWDSICSESITMMHSGITIARYLGPLRFVNALSWERLRGPTLVSGVRFPPHILLEDPWEGKRSYVAIGSSPADVERLKDIIREFRTSTHGAALQVFNQSCA